MLRFFLGQALLLAMATASAEGHALLDHAEPRVGGSVETPPAAVSIWFTQELEPAFSSIQVLDSKGNHVEDGKASIDAANPSLLRVPLKPVPDGTYTVRWRVLSVDTHTTQGSFSFRVGR